VAISGTDLLFRVDASEQIGAGHLVRCLAVADEARAHGLTSAFLAPETGPAYSKWVTEAGHALIDRPPADTKVGWVIVDHYGIGENWLSAQMGVASRSLAIDDLANRPLPVDVLVNPNPWASAEEYRSFVGDQTDLRLGLRFAPIRRPFVSPDQRDHGSIGRVVVALGGGDSTTATRVAIDGVRSALPDVPIDVIVGPRGDVSDFVADPGVLVHSMIGAAEVAGLMARADLAIGAAGTSSWERCATRLPSVVLQLADNQRRVAEALASAGAAVNVGRLSEDSATLVATAVDRLARDPGARQEMADAAGRLVDGRGAARIANILDGVRMRPAVGEDGRLLWEWANDPGTRAASFSPALIPWNTHKDWLTDRLSDPRTLLLIGENGLGPVGQVRLDLGEDVEVSIAVAPDRRGEQLGELLLASALGVLVTKAPGRRLVARVRPGNVVSRRLFEAAGFQLETESRDVLTLARSGETR
jgi:UDP-2,4-diacetamido-2,4,6-trideoxy-beta-L-altropyranose hydrolase